MKEKAVAESIGREKLMAGFEEFEWWFYGGIFIMSLAALLFTGQTVLFAVKKRTIRQKMDEEYGQPLKYHSAGNKKHL